MNSDTYIAISALINVIKAIIELTVTIIKLFQKNK